MKKAMETHKTDWNLEEGCEQYVQNCRRRGLSSYSLKYYREVSNMLMKYIDYKFPLKNINKKVIDNFIYQLQESGIKNTSINTYLNGTRAMVNYWSEEGYLQKFKINKIKVDEVIKETFNSKELDKILKKPNIKKAKFLEYECWVICNFLYGMGARASTVVNLQVEDIDFDNSQIVYKKTKDRRQNVLPLPNSLKDILLEFVHTRKHNEIDHDYLFVNAYGGKLTVDRLNHILNNYYRSRDVGKTGVHIWRHTYSKDYIVAGGSALKLQAQLTHKTLDMTKKYVYLYGEDIRDDKCNPLERRKQHPKMEIKKGR